MGLSDRLAKGRPADGIAAPVLAAADGHPGESGLSHLKDRVQQALFLRLGARLYDSSITEDQLQAFVQQELNEVVQSERAPLTAAERKRLVIEVSHDVLGYGPIQTFLEDSDVTEVMVNANLPIYVERGGRLHRTDARFSSEEQLRRVIERIVGQVGRRIDESSPMVDARLPDGSRVNAIIPPLAVRGPALTIRKFSRDPFQVEDLIQFGTLDEASAKFLSICVEGKLNVLVSGGTGTGKTTLLNVLSSFIPHDERVVTIEDAVELQMHQEHVVTLESRPPNIEGRGEVTIRDLVRNSLRMRPDRIIVGEVRGAEALDMLQAMNTGHEGSLSTLHANTPRDALARLETMVLMAGVDLPVRAIREQVSAAIDVIVHLGRLKDGTRRVLNINEVQGMEGETITLQEIYRFDYQAGTDADGRHQGQLKPTGIRPAFEEKLIERGFALPSDLLGDREALVTQAVKSRRSKKP